MLKQYFMMDQGNSEQDAYQPDQVDKDSLSLSIHLLKANCSQLTCWQVLYPYQSKYMKIYASQSLKEVIVSNIKQPLQFFNTMHIHHIFKYFYQITNLIRIDADGRSREAALNIMQLFGEPSLEYCYFDNFRYGGIYSFSDCFCDLHAASLKQIIKNMLRSSGEGRYKHLRIQFDSSQPTIRLEELLNEIFCAARANLEPFSVLRFLCKLIGLEKSVVLQSDVSLFLQILGLKEIFIEIQRLELDRLILYESDMLQLQQNWTTNHADFTKLVSVSFERTQFESCSRLASGEVSNFNLSFVFLAPKLRLLSFK